MRHRAVARLAAALVLGALLSACASMMPTPARLVDGVYVGANDMTLYTFDRDVASAGKSMCNGQCATNWPPLLATPISQPAGEWSIVTRDDGMRQWAYKGKPLYYWVRDTRAGDRTGDGFSNAWRLARP